jgi:ribosomal protein S25
VDFGSNHLKVYDGRGMGFIISGDKYRNACFSMKNEDISYFLRILSDETCLNVIKSISIDTAVTEKEICDATGIDEATASRILLGLMKRDIVCCDVDNHGKRGYLHSRNMAGVYMVLAGCATAGCGGELNGNLWFSRGEKEQ